MCDTYLYSQQNFYMLCSYLRSLLEFWGLIYSHRHIWKHLFLSLFYFVFSLVNCIDIWRRYYKSSAFWFKIITWSLVFLVWYNYVLRFHGFSTYTGTALLGYSHWGLCMLLLDLLQLWWSGFYQGYRWTIWGWSYVESLHQNVRSHYVFKSKKLNFLFYLV